MFDYRLPFEFDGIIISTIPILLKISGLSDKGGGFFYERTPA
jgi:hypothetical protein